MKNDSRIPSPRKNDKAGQTASRPFTKRSRNRVERAAVNAPKVGASGKHATGRNAGPALADPVSRAGTKARASKKVTLTINLSAAQRRGVDAIAAKLRTTPEDAAKTMLMMVTRSCYGDAEEFLGQVEDARKEMAGGRLTTPYPNLLCGFIRLPR